MSTVDLIVTFTPMDCANCGFTFAVPSAWWQEKHDTHKSIYCPRCKSGSYWPEESDEEKLRAQLVSARDMLDTARWERDFNERRRRAEKAAKTRIKNRVAKGVCPCCNRTFQNLAKHMAGQHPEYTEQ